MKKLWLILCIVTCIFALSACSKSEQEAEAVDPQIAVQVEELSKGYLNDFATITKQDLDAAFLNAEKSKNTPLVDAISSWENVRDELGALVSMDTFEAKVVDGGFEGIINATFEKRSMVFSIILDEKTGQFTSMQFSPHYTLVENMGKAAMNTLMGMGTVFCVLIFISLIIGCFKFINQYETNLKNNNAAPAIEAKQPILIEENIPEPVMQEEELADDLELVAVVTAAIAVSINTPAEGLVVRSIKRVPTRKWNKA